MKLWWLIPTIVQLMWVFFDAMKGKSHHWELSETGSRHMEKQQEKSFFRRNISFRWQRLMHDQTQILSHWPGLRNADNTESKSSSFRTRVVFSDLQTLEITTSTNSQANHYTLILFLKGSYLSGPNLFLYMQYLLQPWYIISCISYIMLITNLSAFQ